MTTEGIDVGDGRIDDGRFGWTTNLSEVGQESGKILGVRGGKVCLCDQTRRMMEEEG